MNAATPSTVVQARMRDGMIGALDLAASFEAQREVQRRAPDVHVPHAVINHWEDWVSARPSRSSLDPAVFTDEEVEAIAAFHDVWTAVADATPNPLPALDQIQQHEGWRWLAEAAGAALQVLLKRGRALAPP